MRKKLKRVKSYVRIIRTIIFLFLLVIPVVTASNLPTIVPTAAAKTTEEEIEDLQKRLEELKKRFEEQSEDVKKLSEELITANVTLAMVLEIVRDLNVSIDETWEIVEKIIKTSSEAKEFAESTKEAANLAKDAAEDAKEKTSALTVIIYGAVGASIVAAVAALTTLMWLQKKLSARGSF